MKDVKVRFRNLISNLKYNQISLETHKLNVTGQLIPWMRKKMLPVVEQLEPRGWDVTDDNTWLNTMFISEVLTWYGKRVAVFITDSYVEYKTSKQLFTSPIMPGFWKQFGIDAHVAVLVDTTMFISAENLDDIYINIDWKSIYSLIDLSGYDDDDNLLPHLTESWGFLEDDCDAEGEFQEWSSLHKIQTNMR